MKNEFVSELKALLFAYPPTCPICSMPFVDALSGDLSGLCQFHVSNEYIKTLLCYWELHDFLSLEENITIASKQHFEIVVSRLMLLEKNLKRNPLRSASKLIKA
jgi:hypothetical protein